MPARERRYSIEEVVVEGREWIMGRPRYVFGEAFKLLHEIVPKRKELARVCRTCKALLSYISFANLAAT